MQPINELSPVGRKPPAVGALTHPVINSSSVHPQTLRGQSHSPHQVRPSQAKPQQTLSQRAKPLQVQPAQAQPPQKQSAQNPPKLLDQAKHRGAQSVTSGAPGQEPKLLDQVSAVLRTKHYDIRTIQELLGHADLNTTMIYTHVLNKGPMGVKNPADLL